MSKLGSAVERERAVRHACTSSGLRKLTIRIATRKRFGSITQDSDIPDTEIIFVASIEQKKIVARKRATAKRVARRRQGGDVRLTRFSVGR
jgi:hypothetical protein